MRLSRFYSQRPLALGTQYLPEDTAHYMSRVLRLQAGAQVQLFDGSGTEFIGQLTEVGKKTVQVELTQQQQGLAESPLQVHLGQGLSRGERMDWVIQKATELGVHALTPLLTERCEVRLNDERLQKRLQHWQQIAISACEQCGRSRLPLIHPPQSVAAWQTSVDAELKLLLHPEAHPLSQHPRPNSLALLIGPEGGLSAAEVEAARAAGFQGVQLGPRVLRTETAPIAALSVANYLWGDFA